MDPLYDYREQPSPSMSSDHDEHPSMQVSPPQPAEQVFQFRQIHEDSPNFQNFSAIYEFECEIDDPLSPLQPTIPLDPSDCPHRHNSLRSPPSAPSSSSANILGNIDSDSYAQPFSTSCNQPFSQAESSSSYDFQEQSSLLLSCDTAYPYNGPENVIPTSLPPSSDSPGLAALYSRQYSPRFPVGHTLHPSFVQSYQLGDELGSGGYGFVMTALHRKESLEVAVKFIIKEKVPAHAWVDDEVYGRMPMEVMLLCLIDHENIVKCLDIFEDHLYFYLVQELHGSPWHKVDRPESEGRKSSRHHLELPSSSPPILSPSASEVSMVESEPETPPVMSNQLYASSVDVLGVDADMHDEFSHTSSPRKKVPSALEPPMRPFYSRRPSHDLFECIEQTQHKRLSEKQAKYIMAQVVEAVHHLDSRGICHRDIKDENLVIDKNLKVKLIDFGSAIVTDPAQPRPFYKLFFGTTAYASAEVLLKQPYQAAPAEIWTLGVLMSYLLTGMSPFPTEKDAIEGRIVLSEIPGSKLSKACLHLMSRCLEPDPRNRADIHEVRAHRWLKGGLKAL